MQVWRQATVPAGVSNYALKWTTDTNAGAIVVEYSGLGAYDTPVFHGNVNGYNSGPSWTTGNSGTLTSANDLLVCFAVDGRDATQSWTISSTGNQQIVAVIGGYQPAK